jgi:hypothetical protein
MKVFRLIAVLSICVVAAPACQKSPSIVAHSAGKIADETNFAVPITHYQLTILNDLLERGKIRNATDFRKKVDSVVTATSNHELILADQKIVTDDYSVANDQTNNATNIGDYPNTLGDENYTNHTKTVYSSFQQIETFNIRKNVIKVVVPFQYSWGTLANAGTNTITNIRAYTPVQLLPAGAFWGEVTPGVDQYVNGGGAMDPWNQTCGISAHGSAQEKRTEIWSTAGQIQISANANILAFQIGEQLSATFTVQRVANIYNQYDMNCNGQINIEGITYGTVPNTNFSGTLYCTDYGILKNQ